jgi:hypothetical protein
MFNRGREETFSHAGQPARKNGGNVCVWVTEVDSFRSLVSFILTTGF